MSEKLLLNLKTNSFERGAYREGTVIARVTWKEGKPYHLERDPHTLQTIERAIPQTLFV